MVPGSRSAFYDQPVPEGADNLALMRVIDEQFLETPWYGSRQMARHLRRHGECVGRNRIRRLMRRTGCRPSISARGRRFRIPSTGSVPTCCEDWHRPARSGLVCGQSPTSRFAAASSTSLRSWTGRAAGPRLAPLEHDGGRLLHRSSEETLRRFGASSTPTRAASSRALASSSGSDGARPRLPALRRRPPAEQPAPQFHYGKAGKSVLRYPSTSARRAAGSTTSTASPHWYRNQAISK